jgi:hypothetical protein
MAVMFECSATRTDLQLNSRSIESYIKLYVFYQHVKRDVHIMPKLVIEFTLQYFISNLVWISPLNSKNCLNHPFNHFDLVHVFVCTLVHAPSP